MQWHTYFERIANFGSHPLCNLDFHVFWAPQVQISRIDWTQQENYSVRCFVKQWQDNTLENTLKVFYKSDSALLWLFCTDGDQVHWVLTEYKLDARTLTLRCWIYLNLVHAGMFNQPVATLCCFTLSWNSELDSDTQCKQECSADLLRSGLLWCCYHLGFGHWFFRDKSSE